MVREMLAYHARSFDGPGMQVNQARALLEFLIQAAGAREDAFALALREEWRLLRDCPDSYLYHEHLERENTPVYFHQFAERAASKGLRYLGDADLSMMAAHDLSPGATETLRTLSPDLIRLEQYLDFARNRTFRMTLLGHADATPDYGLECERLTGLSVSSAARCSSVEPDLRPGVVVEFHNDGLGRLSTGIPLLKAAMFQLIEACPRSVPFVSLVTAARSSLGRGPDLEPDDLRALGSFLLDAYTSTGLVDLHVHEPRFVMEIGERPIASPLARIQGATEDRVTNLRHRSIVLSERERRILVHTDGTHDRDALGMVLEEFDRKTAPVPIDRGSSECPSHQGSEGQSLEEILDRLRRHALLSG
jgi:methyltransferase-like protein